MNQFSAAALGVLATGPVNVPLLHSEEHESLIHASRDRSYSYGVAESDEPDFSSLAIGLMKTALEENRFLYQHAAPVMETLFHQIANTHSMVVLTARSGMILHSLGDDDFVEKASRVALRPGVDWSEKSKGTNAIGTALAEERPVVVHGAQHYLQANRFLTCSCTPIVDPYGKVIGALDVTGDQRSYHQHTMALARMSAQMIENQMFADIFPNEVIVRFHARPEFIGTLMQGVAVFSPDGRFLTANRSAQFQLGLSANSLTAHTFSSLFGHTLSQLYDRLRHSADRAAAFVLYNGVKVFCICDHKLSHHSEAFQRTSADVDAPQTYVAPVRRTESASPMVSTQHKEALSSLRYLDSGDPQISAVIEKLHRMRGRDIPIMILGETGTGKDLLAHAIHNDSPRAHNNFVAVNCASIPETLIESELFGYEEGAFTGARRKGAVGKVLLANGGTLFLDEIGDMPRNLQARLLRVLQERKVSPLGSGKEVDVDVAVICATNKNLKDMMARGEFREDLYYRIYGMAVRLPPLRERQDIEMVTRKILASVCLTGKPMDIAPDVMALFRRYSWPGNMRQLFNLLRTAVVMAGDSSSVRIEHLPEEFIEELNEAGSWETAGSRIEVEMADTLQTPAATSAPLEPLISRVAEDSTSLEKVALKAMAQALRVTQGNVSVAAKMLGVSRNTIYRKKDQLPEDVWR